MKGLDMSTPPHQSCAASTGASTTTMSSASPPAISTMCVDVRELLRHSAAASKDVPSDAQAAVSGRQPYTAVAPSKAPSQPPRQPQATSPSCRKESTFWSPSYPPRGGFAGNSGPPPLSPTDATILHSILGQPTLRKTVLSSFDQLIGRTSSPLTREPRTRRPSLASTSPPPIDSSSTWGTSAHAEDGVQALKVGAATPLSALSEKDTSPPTPLRDVMENYLDGEGSHSAGAAASMDFSPAGQRTMKSLLGQLNSYASGLAAAHTRAVTEMPTSSNRGGVAVWPITYRQAAMKFSAAGPSAASPLPFSGASAHRRKGGAAATRPTVAQLWRRCPALAASTFSRVDTSPQRSHDTVQAVVAPPQGLAYDRPHVAADRSTVPLRKALQSPPRTVPPAFRRQLQFTEEAPTTRRPKRR
ncbi:conserved hypothetical protein [Leishmania major strain Friedlin]|uniref:Uncharacterized protein n=1 Tax=Leishmania major TaxID=5664 RepID=E9AG15_LEIMA|nr:conserved hypothetical protein [Leishmania major strain Friedlin]CAG9583713.1 hypothetical_protein_-_conserved [Leishmania major strain Friedlin]CBZ05900.1 conserved hypothetical protein [Leishmania major strain Friedlin]|eukprot:XP_003722935.1 conserved hypothetical protein [Leishmania major strain Friedlin]